MPLRLPRLASLAALALAVAACVPDTIIRRSAFVPAPAGPALTGRPLARGEVKLSGGLAPVMLRPTMLADIFPEVGDPGLFVPVAQLTGSAYVGVSRSFELGAELNGAPFSWAMPTSMGVLGMPKGGRLTSYSGGVGARWTHRFEHAPIWMGLSGELDLANVPEAVYVRCGCSEGEGDAAYVLDHTENNLFLVPNLYLQLGGDIGEHLTISLLAGRETGITNVGFEPDASTIDDSTLTTYALDVVGAGLEGRWNKLRVELNLLQPFGGAAGLDFAPELVLRMSAVL